MTSRSFFQPVRALTTAAALLAVFSLASAPKALAQQDAQAQMNPEKLSPGEVSKPAELSKPHLIEARINELHKKLMITSAQEAAWNDLAKVMHDNAETMKGLLEKWIEQDGKMNAVENLKHHGEMAQAQDEGMKKLIPAFENLYNMMSDSQKKNADKLFAYGGKRIRHKRQ